MGAAGSQSGISFNEEVTWGEMNPGQFTGMNFTSDDLEYKPDYQSSKNVRPDRQVANVVKVDAECTGGMETEFQANNLDGLLPGMFWAADWKQPLAGDDVSFANEIAPGQGGVLTFAAGAVSVANFSIGQVFEVKGSALNDGFHNVKILGTDAIIVEEPLVDESSVTVTFAGDQIRNGISQTSYSFERANYDVSQYFLYSGMMGNTFEMAFESGSPVIAKLNFVGKNEALAQAPYSSPAPTALSTSSIINSGDSIGAILIDGVAVPDCLIQKMDFKLDQKTEGRKGVSVVGACSVAGKTIEVTGNIVMYFSDNTYYDKFNNSEFFGIQIEMADTTGNVYIIQLPSCIFDTGKANVTGKDDDVLFESTFKATMGLGGFTIQITRALV